MRICLISLLFFFGLSIMAQDPSIDSLKHLVKHGKEDTLHVKSLMRLTGKVRYSSPADALPYAEEGLRISKKIGWDVGILKSTYMMAVCHYFLSNFDLALSLCREVTKEARLRNRAQVEADAHNLIGSIYSDLESADSSLHYLLLSLEILEKNNLLEGIEYTYTNIGSNYDNKGDFIRASKYYRLAIPIAKDNRDSFLLSLLYSNLSASTDSVSYAHKAVEIAQKIDDKATLAYAYNNIGGHDAKMDRTNKALDMFNRALKEAKQMELHYFTALLVKNIGDQYLKLDSIKLAEKAFLQAVDLSKKYNNKEAEQYAYYGLASVYEKKKDFQRALSAFKEYNDLKDTLFAASIPAQISKFNAEFDAAQKDKRIAEQNLAIANERNKRNRYIVLGVIVLLIFSLLYLFYFVRSQKKKREAELALQKQIVESQKLKEIDTLKSTFFTNISHELRTPLTLISGPLEEALDKVKNPSLKNDIVLARKNSLSLLSLVDEILDLSKLDAGKLALNTSDKYLHAFLRRVFYAFDSLANIRKIVLLYENDLDESIVVRMDFDKVEKIVNNLVSNAIKFSPTKTSVKMRVKKIKNDFIAISVIDEAGGVLEKDIDRIFDRFYQSTVVNAPLKGGTGVGLALSKELATFLDGDLVVQSEYGKGSTFTLSLPLVLGDMIESETTEVTTIKKHTHKHLGLGDKAYNILIVDDNADIVAYITSLLSWKYNCYSALNGKEALDIIKSQQIDLISCDVMMPEMDGFELRKRMNEDDDLRYISFIFLTARSLEEDKIYGLQLGVDDYITKPFSKHELLARVENLLRLKEERVREGQESEDGEKLQSATQKFVEGARNVVLDRLSDTSFKVSTLATEMGYSPKQLGRILKKATGYSSVQFILEIRLLKARQLLEQKKYHTVTEVLYAIGLESPAYFSTKFTERFGKNPSEYLST